MSRRMALEACLIGMVAAGCAAKPASTIINDDAATPVWTGALQPTQQRSGSLVVTGLNRAFGTVRIWSQMSGTLERMHVSLSVAVPTGAATSLRWAVLPERCGSGDLPLIGFEQFPLIDVSNNGRAQIETDLPLVMTANNVYHVNIYNGGQQLDNVVTCANLKYEQPSH